jgi:hypothetical protein
VACGVMPLHKGRIGMSVGSRSLSPVISRGLVLYVVAWYQNLHPFASGYSLGLIKRQKGALRLRES